MVEKHILTSDWVWRYLEIPNAVVGVIFCVVFIAVCAALYWLDKESNDDKSYDENVLVLTPFASAYITTGIMFFFGATVVSFIAVYFFSF